MPNDTDLIYSRLEFPEHNLNRPYTYIDMVSTIDGKITSGNRNEAVLDLGSKTDHLLMRRIAAQSDAILVGAETVRVSPLTWDPGDLLRIVVSGSGVLPFQAGFFREKSFVATSGQAAFEVPPGVGMLRSGSNQIDFSNLLLQVKGLGVKNLLILGGSHLNGQMLRNSLVDELFLTIAPKVKLGDGLPTYAGGEAFSRANLPSFHLVEHHVVADEVFLRYRRREDGGRGEN